MARRKKHSSTHRRITHRRRYGAISGLDMKAALLSIGGGVAARLLVTKLPDTIGGVDISKFKPFAPLVIGFMLPKIAKNAMIKPLAEGMIVVGGLNALQSFNVIGAMGHDAPMVGWLPPHQIAKHLTMNGTTAMVAGHKKNVSYAG